ncbi:glycosyltransferase family 4 protein [Rhizobium sp. FY34]|uniref:glycosyltransferase family 4 protein n=1 Tax=Rhizobium sp. FY34 TaxID=2562309 RepID=UPI001485548F|nr:glycosyltransferase family 4 protein [Rhizobium sp. FY34]
MPFTHAKPIASTPCAKVYWLASADYARRTGGYVYNSALNQALMRQGIEVHPLMLKTGFPSVSRSERVQLAGEVARLGTGAVILTDHIYLCDLLEVFAQTDVSVVSIFHHSLVMEHGQADDDQARKLRAREQAAMQRSSRILVTSQDTARYIAAHYGVAEDRIHVAVPGNDRVERASVGARGLPISILSVGAIIPRKRYDYILDVAAALCDDDWRWSIVGDPQRYPEHAAALAASADALGLSHRLAFLGDVSETALEALWQATDLYVAASFYEGYGMAVAEAFRHGVPVITTASGAVSSWASGGIIQAPAEDAPAMAALIRPLLARTQDLYALSHAAWDFGQTLPSWEETFESVGTWVVGGG